MLTGSARPSTGSRALGRARRVPPGRDPRSRPEGRERLGDARNTVIISNHVSHLDAPVLFLALGVDFKAVAKKEVFDVPFFSAVLRRAGFIPVDRGDRTQAAGAVARMVAALRGGRLLPRLPRRHALADR